MGIPISEGGPALGAKDIMELRGVSVVALDMPMASESRSDWPEAAASGVYPTQPLAMHAWQDLYEAHADAVYRTLQRLGLTATDAKDALQEVFLVAHRRGGTYDAERGSPRAWLIGIAVNVARTEKRRAKRLVATDSEQVSTVASRPGDGEKFGQGSHRQHELRRVLTRAVAALSEEFRVPFQMFELESLSCAEIAAELGLPVGTVYSRLHGAREQLRVALQDFAVTGGVRR